MKKCAWLLLLLGVLLALLGGSMMPALAQDDEEEEKRENYLSLRLTAVNGDRHPYGWIRVDGYDFGLGASKLRPQAIYSVWLVKANGEKVGIGEAPFSFETRESGEGKYVIRLQDVNLFSGDYQRIVVFHHPSNQPEKTDDLLPILEARLR
ncbi:MAG: hypothetical protein AB1758_34570 [Candidatus Eremiobacterota bacterium]